MLARAGATITLIRHHAVQHVVERLEHHPHAAAAHNLRYLVVAQPRPSTHRVCGRVPAGSRVLPRHHRRLRAVRPGSRTARQRARLIQEAARPLARREVGLPPGRAARGLSVHAWSEMEAKRRSSARSRSSGRSGLLPGFQSAMASPGYDLLSTLIHARNRSRLHRQVSKKKAAGQDSPIGAGSATPAPSAASRSAGPSPYHQGLPAGRLLV